MSTCVASIDVALLGCGNVGSAIVRLAQRELSRAVPVNVTGALVRDGSRSRATALPVHTDAHALLSSHPDVIVEVLGGVEPARTLLLSALERRIPVVTANKTLLAYRGGELRRAAAATGTPLLYEAAVLAGVPFLGTFARRPLAASATSLVGIVNGTSNYVLTKCAAEGAEPVTALAEAQRLGFAEPDPAKDVSGEDAAEKLAVLIQHFAAREVHPGGLAVCGIDGITAAQIAHASALGGVIKPVVQADWTNRLEAFAGPAFVPSSHSLARVDGVENVLLLGTQYGRLLFQGPGAGPDVTAATVLDDVREIQIGAPYASAELPADRAAAPDTPWMLTLAAARLPRAAQIADLLASYGVFAQRTTSRDSRWGSEHQSLLTWSLDGERIDAACTALTSAACCEVDAIRALEVAA
jgi:homoserine dehydrogenase